MYNLTQHQEEKMQIAITAIREKKPIRIVGSAGVGKTYLVSVLIKELSKYYDSSNFILAAPTNRAAKVLEEKSITSGPKFSTVHSAFGLVKSTKKDGTVIFKRDPKRLSIPADDATLLLVDEASMLDEDLVRLVMNKARSIPVIFVGDSKQLYPVGEKEISSSLRDQRITEIELTEIIRQKEGSSIITLSRDLKLLHSGEDDLNSNGEGYLFTNDIERIYDSLAYYGSGNTMKFLAYTNDRVNKVNSIVREKIYGSNPAKIIVGENIIVNAPYGNADNGDIIEIKNIRIVRVPRTVFEWDSGKVKESIVMVECYSINYIESTDPFTGAIIISDKFLVPTEEGDKTINPHINTALDLAKDGHLRWPLYYELKDSFLNFGYSYAITVHKAQGSTYDYCIIDRQNLGICRGPEKENLHYTAVTRAANLNIILENGINKNSW